MVFDSSEERFLSFFTLADFLQALLACQETETSYESLAILSLQETFDSLQIDLSSRSRLCAVHAEEGIRSLLFLFREYSAPHVAVLDPDSTRALGLVSPEILLSYIVLACFYERLDFMDTPLSETAAFVSEPVTLDPATTLRDAFHRLQEANLFAAPVVGTEGDEAGVVLGVYAKDDVRFLARSESVTDMLSALDAPIRELIPASVEGGLGTEVETGMESGSEEKEEGEGGVEELLKKKEGAKKVVRPCPVLHPSSSVGEVLRRFVDTRSHLLLFGEERDERFSFRGLTTPLLLLEYLLSLDDASLGKITGEETLSQG